MTQARSTALLAAAALLALPAPASAGQDQALPLPPAGWQDNAAAPNAEASAAAAASVVAAVSAASDPIGQEAPQQPGAAHAHQDMDQDEAGHPRAMDSAHPAGMPMQHRMHHEGMSHAGMMQGAAPRFAYSPAQRAAWLDECRANQLPQQRRTGGLLGGLLGAVVGGVAGNRIADGSRLAGTLIGGGVGAVAGAVIGSAIDRNGDDEREARAFDFCEDYLGRYEAGAMAQPPYGYGYGQPAGYAMAVPMMMVALPVSGRRSVEREEIIEEWVEEVPPARVHRTPAPAKRVPIKLVPAK